MAGQKTPASDDDTSGTTHPSRPSIPIPRLPPGVDSKRVLWYGGLAALAAIEVIEWPVAVVVGIGSYVAERLAREDVENSTSGDHAEHSTPKHS